MKSRLQKTPIAIIGIASIFPDAKNISEYWTNIVKEVDCIKDVPETRWSIRDYYDPDPSKPDKSYSKRGGFIPDIDFDPMEFGLPPNLLEVTEVSQLLALVLAKEVLKDGGYANADSELKKRIGVILGVGGAQKLMNPLMSRLQYPIWERVLESVGVSAGDTRKIVDKIKKAYVNWEENSFPGTLGNVVAGRIANRFDLGGTNCVVDAACASSFSGIRMAVHELLDYRSDLMITGGVDTDNSIYAYMCFSKTPAFSHREKSQPFDRNSAGMIIGEGIGMLLLKRLEDAERDEDRIYAVIKGIGTSSDGKSKSIYAPRPEGQLIALERAYRDAGIKPKTVGLIEAHGTGTPAGDTAETTALKTLFGKENPKKGHIALGSVKSQIGHTKNAAGVAGLIKAAMALHHKILPATINVQEPNPKLELENSPFYLNTEVRPWIVNDKTPRRAGISAFGFGGTNFHIVLEERQSEHRSGYRRHTLPQPLFFHAQTKKILIENLKGHIPQLKSKDAEYHFDRLKQSGRSVELPPKNARIGFVAGHADEAVSKLESALEKLKTAPDESSWKLKTGVYFRSEGLDLKERVVALFAGQGSSYPNMGRELACHFPPVREWFRKMDSLFLKNRRTPISEIVYPAPTFVREEQKADAARLRQTENAQPAIGALSAAQYQIFRQAGLKPTYAAGHSFGELTALWSAGVYDDEDLSFLACSRGRAMAAPNRANFDAGTMTAVLGNVEKLEGDIATFQRIVMANMNSGNQVVIAGPRPEMERARKHLRGKGYKLVSLPVSAAFHTPMVKHAQKPFSEAVAKVAFKRPQFSVYSNATGKPYPLLPKSIKKRLNEHILNPVQFKKEIENIYRDGGTVFVEFGPQNILTRLTDSILGDKPHLSIAINPDAKGDSDRQLREAFVHLKVSGLPLTEIDQYEDLPTVDKRPDSSLTLQLNGTNYISEKTRREFEEGLVDDHSIASQSNFEPVSEPLADAPDKTETNRRETETLPTTHTHENDPNRTDILSNLFRHQNELMRVHEQFLTNQVEYSRSFLQILQHNAQSGNAGRMAPEVSESISQFHRNQAETLRVHELYLSSQTEQSRQSFELMGQLPNFDITPDPPRKMKAPPAIGKPEPEERAAAVLPEPVRDSAERTETESVLPSNTAVSEREVADIVMQVVSEKTGYLSNMLELDMDIEADLGIDSIKRVEILNGIREKLPYEIEPEPEALPEIRTLGQIVKAFSNLSTDATERVPQRSNGAVSIPATAPADSLPQAEKNMADTLLSIISEKTGYLKSMLELDMELESDLGIDSIKRVEILNEFMERLPGLSDINTESMAELKTLGQIVAYVDRPENGSSSSESSNGGKERRTAATRSAVNGKAVSQALLAIVGEKTGYQKEMLELDMDLEADLGIDSIKRVEILNGLREKLPSLSVLNPEELSEARTLREIVDYLNTLSSAHSVSAPSSPPDPMGTDLKEEDRRPIADILLKVVSEKTGYPQEMLSEDMNLETDLGIDSIKRVEILNALQEALPQMYLFNPDDLNDLTTISQIAGQIDTRSGKKKLQT